MDEANHNCFDLIWCLYCDWMTGVYAFGGEMLRNVESFWCPIRFYDGKKCENCKIDFPDIEKWASEVRLMRERDGRTEEQIRFLIGWCQKDNFWQANILSMKKLREKFDTLVSQVKRSTLPKTKKEILI